jgi:predicted RNA-binding Zn ribbon-like protein
MNIQPASASSSGDQDFRFRSGRLCLDFVATVGDRAHVPIERWRDGEDFARWCIRCGLLHEWLSVTTRQLTKARELREAIYGLVQCALQSRKPGKAAFDALNKHAASPGLVPTMSGIGVPLTWHSPNPFEAVLSMVARDAIDLLCGSQLHRVRECADEHCSILFIDMSRPGKRRWCAMNGCGNRDKKTAYRVRQRERSSGRGGKRRAPEAP